MKILRSLVTLIVIICFCAVLLVGCEMSETTDDLTKQSSEQSSEQHYTNENFNSLVVGKSTFSDVCNLFPQEQMPTVLATSYGVYCDYPMQSGGYIRMKFYGKDLILFAIEEIM